MSSRRALSFLLASLIGSSAVPARAESAASSYALQACALAYENSQEHRREGALSLARSEFARCSQDDCPGFIRADCSQWSKEAQAEQPSLVFEAKRSGVDLTVVRVSIEGRVLAEKLPAEAIELDPGNYDVQFETPGSAAVVRHVVLRAGDKDLRVQVDFSTPPGGSNPAPAAPLPVAVSASDGSSALPWVLLGVGAASIGAGVGLAAWGHGNENQLQATCSPNCSSSDVRSVRTKYLLGDLSVGVGLVTASVAAYLFLSHRGPEQAAQSAPPVSVGVGPGSVFAAYGARF